MCVCVGFSTLSKYGVHGFPTIILLNSTMRVAYRGSRTLDSLATFYSDVTGKDIYLVCIDDRASSFGSSKLVQVLFWLLL